MTLSEILWCHKTSFGKELKVEEVPRIPSTKLLAKSYDSHLKLFPQFAAEYSPYPALAAIVYCVALAQVLLRLENHQFSLLQIVSGILRGGLRVETDPTDSKLITLQIFSLPKTQFFIQNNFQYTCRLVFCYQNCSDVLFQ